MMWWAQRSLCPPRAVARAFTLVVCGVLALRLVLRGAGGCLTACCNGKGAFTDRRRVKVWQTAPFSPVGRRLGAAIRCMVAGIAKHGAQRPPAPPPVRCAGNSQPSRTLAHMSFTATLRISPLPQPKAFSFDVIAGALSLAHRIGANGRAATHSHRLQRVEAHRARQLRQGHGLALVDVEVDPPQLWWCGRAPRRAAGAQSRAARQRYLSWQWIQCVSASLLASSASRVRALAR